MTSAHPPPPPLSQWDRDPSLIIDPLTGAVTTTKAYDVLRKNFILANYNSLGAVDNDDGSSYYISESNFFVYGGGGGLILVRALLPCARLSPFAPPFVALSRVRFCPCRAQE